MSWYKTVQSVVVGVSFKPVNSSVPASSQGEVDDHVHGDQISHRLVVGSHGAQDALSSLNTEKKHLQVP